jgi:hypothetical protein
MCTTVSCLKNNGQHRGSAGNFIVSVQSYSKSVVGTDGYMNSSSINAKLIKMTCAWIREIMNRVLRRLNSPAS